MSPRAINAEDVSHRSKPVTENNSTIEIPLTLGYFATVDEIDNDLQLDTWRTIVHKVSGFYAHRYEKTDHGWCDIRMHRVILERMIGRPLVGKERADHKDRNGLNNRRSNLRLADFRTNALNAKLRKDNKSGMKGVCWSIPGKRWRAYGKSNGKQIHLGYFDTVEEAHEAYKRFALEHYGEFARFE